MSPEISVVICTHNPRADYLARTLAALRAQTLPAFRWELLVVDNCSEPALAGSLDLGWHPGSRILREERLGLAHGRVCGLENTTGGLIVFVDDDNVMADDFLENVLKIAEAWPMLGTWGGRVTAQFEEPPPDWLLPFTHHLAVSKCSQTVWSSFVTDRALPVGAGLCLRRSVADVYLAKTRTDPMHSRFGRTKKKEAVAGDDQYICLCAETIGLGSGKFPQLRLEHIIPPSRTTPAYFLRVARGNAHGAMLLHAVWQTHRNHSDKFYWPIFKMAGSLLLYRGMRRRILLAEARGEFSAMCEARRLRKAARPKPAVIPGAAQASKSSGGAA